MPLYEAVKAALYAVPSFFRSELAISDVLATDLFSFNTSLGALIESQVVATLNALRNTWDPDQQYATYRFIRQSQRFPDVILRTSVPGTQPEILLGIELKGWYLLAKEKEPSFRYTVSPSVCSPNDLLVVYPWALSHVISGSPQLFEPYIESARRAAENRNRWWQEIRDTSGDRGIVLSSVSTYYPTKTERIADSPASDSGGNFGRFARTGLMDDYMRMVLAESLAGIPINAWQRFFIEFTERRGHQEAVAALDRWLSRESRQRVIDAQEVTRAIRSLAHEILRLTGESSPPQD